MYLSWGQWKLAISCLLGQDFLKKCVLLPPFPGRIEFPPTPALAQKTYTTIHEKCECVVIFLG